MSNDLVSRARAHAETHPESRDIIAELLAMLPPQRPTVDICKDIAQSFRSYMGLES